MQCNSDLLPPSACLHSDEVASKSKSFGGSASTAAMPGIYAATGSPPMPSACFYADQIKGVPVAVCLAAGRGHVILVEPCACGADQSGALSSIDDAGLDMSRDALCVPVVERRSSFAEDRLSEIMLGCVACA